MKIKLLSVILVLLLLAAIGCGYSGTSNTSLYGSVQATGTPGSVALAANTALQADVASAWMALVCNVIETEKLTPPQASRLIGYTGVALYESVLPALTGYRSLFGQLNEMPAMPKAESNVLYNWPASIAAALSVTLKAILPSMSANSSKLVSDLADKQVNAQTNVALDIMQRSRSFGEAVGNAVLGWAGSDGFKTTRNLTYNPPTGAGMWVPTSPGNKPALEPYWGNLRPFALYSVDTCVPPAPFSYSTENTSAFYQQALCVYNTYNNLTDEQKAIANFWADNSGVSYTPPGHWLSIENQMVKQLSLPIDKAVQMYAVVGVAMADAFISCWHAKFQYCIERPITYINQYIDPNWAPMINTPPFPEYTSGHSVVSGAVSLILTQMLGKVTFTDTSYTDKGIPARTFNSFEQAAQEAAVSRLYGGIHFPVSIQLGVQQGQLIGQAVLDRVQTAVQ